MTFPSSITKYQKEGIEVLLIDNEKATCEISLFGAHVLSFKPKKDNRERLWVSPHAILTGKKPIRGGIPLCWPWFSDDHGQEKGALPSHGFLRTQTWTIGAATENQGTTAITLHPETSKGDGFEYDTDVSLTLLVGDTLSVSLETTNLGDAPITFNSALHTYFNVADIHHTTLIGVDGPYKDKLDRWLEKSAPVPYTFHTETDRIHQCAPARVEIEQAEGKTVVDSLGHDSMVVWNPWQSAANIADMDPFGYRHMLCVETAITNGCTLEPKATHTLTQVIG